MHYLVGPVIILETLSKTSVESFSTLSKNLVRTVLYYDVFDHPLTLDELQEFSSHPVKMEEMKEQLQHLVDAKILYESNGYFAVKPNINDLVARRNKGERAAQLATKKAHDRSLFIGKFPYVKAAYISGSMAKGVMHEDGDVDFFIITEPGRLWLARTLLILYKKTFLLNSHEFFCVNYFIDSDNLEIEEKNLFSATEAVTLKPIYDSGVYQDFRKANSWVNDYFPNNVERQIIYNGNTDRKFANAIERLFKNGLGDRIDKFLMNTTLRFWKKKFNHFDDEDFSVAMKTRTYVSKHHPRNFQRKVMDALAQRITEFEQKHEVTLS